MCCRATCWQAPSRSGSAPQQTAGRPRSTHRPHPRPRPGDHQPPSGLRRKAADIPGRTPRFERLGSRGRVPVSASGFPKRNSGRKAQTQEPLQAFLPRCSTLEHKKGLILSTRKDESQGGSQQLLNPHNFSTSISSCLALPHNSCTIFSKGRLQIRRETSSGGLSCLKSLQTTPQIYL